MIIKGRGLLTTCPTICKDQRLCFSKFSAHNYRKVSSDAAAGTDQFIVYNQSKYCSFRPWVSGSTPGAGKSMPAGMPATMRGPQQLHFLVDLVHPHTPYYVEETARGSISCFLKSPPKKLISAYYVR